MASKFLIAPIGKRFSAGFLDGLFSFVFAYAALLILRDIIPETGNTLVAISIYLGYGLFADGLFNGQSLGSKFYGLYVVNNETEAPCGFGKSFIRNICGFTGVIDLLFLIFREDRRRLGDLAAKTKVIIKLP